MTTKDFLPKLSDPGIGQKMASTKSPQEAYTFAKTNGVTDSFEVFVAEMERLKAAVGELSEDDLASVAGGMSEQEIIELTISTTVPAAASAAVAAL